MSAPNASPPSPDGRDANSSGGLGRRLGRGIARLGLALGAALLALLPGEIGLADSGLATERLARVIYLQGAYPSLHQESADGVLHYTLRPGASLAETGPFGPFTMHINALGARGPERSREKPPDTLRILCFGPSTTFGAGVNDDQTIPAALEDHLRAGLRAAGSSREVEVWNFGTSAYVTSQTARLARLKLDELDPDLLVMLISNPGRRAFLPVPDLLTHDWRRWASVDPGFWEENALRPRYLPRRLHETLLSRSSLYLYWNAQQTLGMGPELGNALGEALSLEMAGQLMAAAKAQGTELFVVSWQGEHARYYPGLPADRTVDLLPQLQPEERARIVTHPPAPILAAYGARVGEALIAAGLVLP